eukprot:s717_g16.t1
MNFLILSQHRADQHPVLLTALFDHPYHRRLWHRAVLRPKFSSSAEIYDDLGVVRFCQLRICTIQCGLQDIAEDQLIEVSGGESVVVTITQTARPIPDSEDEVSLTQHIPQHWAPFQAQQRGLDMPTHAHPHAEGFCFNIQATEFRPAQRDLSTMPNNVQELHAHWRVSAFSWEEELAPMEVIAWFVGQHCTALHHCERARRVRLFEDFWHWEAILKHTWRDLLFPGASLDWHVVTPTPPMRIQGASTHIIRIQNPTEGLASCLLTMYDAWETASGPTSQAAITVQQQFLLEHLIFAMNLQGRCLTAGSPMRCTAWHDRHPLQLGVPFPVQNGYGLILQLTRRQTFRTAPVMLQLSSVLSQPKDRRLTQELVAHTPGPAAAKTTAIKLIRGQASLPPLPPFLEVDHPVNRSTVQTALSDFGLDCRFFLLADHTIALCFGTR